MEDGAVQYFSASTHHLLLFYTIYNKVELFGLNEFYNVEIFSLM